VLYNPDTPRSQARRFRCAHCGDSIPSGRRRPRLFCDRPGCRKAASRARHKPAPKPVEPVEFCDSEQAWLRGYRAPDFSARTTAPGSSEARKQRAACHSIQGGIVNLIGGEKTSQTLDPNLVRKILAAELGTPIATLSSLDGVIVSVTPKHSTSSAAPPTGRGNEGSRHPAR
jgi:hypothetical protein